MFAAQITDNLDSLFLLEKLLIQLLGYPDLTCRDNAVILLNSLYDENDWQLSVAFRPAVRCIGQHFKVNLTIKVGNFDSSTCHLFMGVQAPSPLGHCNDPVLTWHKIVQRNIVQTNSQETEITINFGKFWKCGFYDWRVMQCTEGRIQTVMLTKPPVLHSFPLSKATSSSVKIDSEFYDEPFDDLDPDQLVAQGRYIVQPKGIRDETFHEVQIDL